MQESKQQQSYPKLEGSSKNNEQKMENSAKVEEEPTKKEQISSLRDELLAMQFQPDLVDRALEHTSDLQKAIEFIVSLLEQQDIKERLKIEQVSMVLLVRMDLKMGLGKVAAQCAHATLQAYRQARNRAQKDQDYSLTFIKWLETGQQKVAYQVEDEKQLFQTLKKFQAMGAGICHIRDAGRTQIAAGSVTVGGVGPYGSKQLDAVTNALRRL